MIFETPRDYLGSLELPPATHDQDPAEIFVKLLAPNDNSSRHGIVIPQSAYAFFPLLDITNPQRNVNLSFEVFDVAKREAKDVSWIYYHRYPERRITRAGDVFNRNDSQRRMIIFIRLGHRYLLDYSIEGSDERFNALARLFFSGAAPVSSAYALLPVNAGRFAPDEALSELLSKFDEIKSLGFVPALRKGTTGVGYTFETLAGIEENNSQEADYKGIEIKSMLDRDAGTQNGKVNLFQCGPRWDLPAPNAKRLETIGSIDEEGRLACYSAVSIRPNNNGLWLSRDPDKPLLRIQKRGHDADVSIGTWSLERLGRRLAQKHTRAVFVSARRRRGKDGADFYHYRELLYCEEPSIERFVDLIHNRRIIFEFTMRQEESGGVRNHGYPWRLVSERDLDLLFARQIKLRLA